MIYLLTRADGSYALFHSTTGNYTWWCPTVKQCWDILYRDYIEYSLDDIIQGSNATVVEVYAVETHPEHFI